MINLLEPGYGLYININSLTSNKLIKKFFQTTKRGKDFRNKLKHPGISPDKDFFIICMPKRLVGCALIRPELEIKRVILEGYVSPGYRRKGHGTLLLNKALERSRDLYSGKIHVCISSNNKAGKEFLKYHKFKQIRSFLEMEIQLDRCNHPENISNNIIIENLKQGQEKKLAEIQNQIFKGAWGFCPNTAQDIRYYMSLTGSDFEDILFLERNSRPFGYFWSHIISDQFKQGKAIKRARIHMFGLKKDFRSQGVGKLLLKLGLNHLKKQNINTVVLTVDSLNYPAVSLYRDLGFRVTGRKHWYELLLNHQ